MDIIHIAAEVAPIAKIGGLADVVFGLSRELIRQGHQVKVIIPKYDCVDLSPLHDLEVDVEEFFTDFEGERYSNKAWRATCMDLPVYFIETMHPRAFLDRGKIYGCEDDADRFLYFSAAARDLIVSKGWSPDVVHTHDWQTGVVPTLYKELDGAKTVFTIHNIEYQGQCQPEQLTSIGLEGPQYLKPDLMQDHSDRAKVNLMKGGIVYADFVTTVSPSYAEEVTGWLGGRGLDPTIMMNRQKFRGVLNGLDYEFWNPQTDPYLPANFSLSGDHEHTLKNRAIVTKALRESMGLADEDRPIVGVVTRLVPQKGIHLIKHALYRTIELGGQFVLLGSSPIPEIQAEFEALRDQFQDHSHVQLELGHDEELSHLIFGGSDMMLIPSLFEPCGLVQLIALRYGSVPIVRRTGGLADTIEDVNYSEKPISERNGYTFDHTDANALNSALDRAIHCWKHHPEVWLRLREQGMSCDFSWERSAREYVGIYEDICAK